MKSFKFAVTTTSSLAAIATPFSTLMSTSSDIFRATKNTSLADTDGIHGAKDYNVDSQHSLILISHHYAKASTIRFNSCTSVAMAFRIFIIDASKRVRPASLSLGQWYASAETMARSAEGSFEVLIQRSNALAVFEKGLLKWGFKSLMLRQCRS